MVNSVMAGITKTKLYDKTANYYDWKEIYPQLKLLHDNIEDLKSDAKLIDTVRTYLHTCNGFFLNFLLVIFNSPIFLFLRVFIIKSYSGYRGRKITILNLTVEKRIGRYFRFYTPSLPRTRKRALGLDRQMNCVRRQAHC